MVASIETRDTASGVCWPSLLSLSACSVLQSQQGTRGQQNRLLSCDSSGNKYLKDDVLFNFQRCRRRVFLDHHGNPQHRNAPSDYLLKIRQDSLAHRQQILDTYANPQHPSYPKADWTAGTQATLALMEEGTDCIYQGVLLARSPTPNSPTYISQPDLLIKQPGPSWFGDYHYLPVDIRLGKKPKPEYQLVAAFHAYLLSALQGNILSISRLMLKQKRYDVDLARQQTALLETIENCSELLTADAAPEVFISRNRCDMCVWLPHCYEEALQQQHLSLMPGVTINRYKHLQPLSITSVEALADMTPAGLAQASGFEPDVAQKLVVQANSTLRGEAIARPHSSKPFALAPYHLPTGSHELYFDIEAAPDKDLVYLHGVLVVETATGMETFIPLVAEQLEEEARAWQQFQYVMAEYPDAPVYHFCPYEAQTVRRLAKQYGQIIDVEALLNRFVDIHQRITAAAVLPVESYALKPIARWIGFDWRDDDANGAQSICWYDDWLTSGDRAHLDAILRYNEDDCRATYWVKRWLTEFAQPYWVNAS